MEPVAEGLTIVVPAHNESGTLPRLLHALAADGLPHDIEVLVVCNGCTDDTAEVASRFRGVQVVEIAEASKKAALAEGDRRAAYAVRGYIDADVVITQPDILALYRSLRSLQVLAVAPRRILVLDRASLAVKWYYDVWQQLPQVRAGLFGRGVIVLSSRGHERIASLPKVMSDDLMASEAFGPEERAVVPDAIVRVWGPRTIRDLLRRRIRVSTGNSEMDGLGLRAAGSKTSMRSLAALTLRSPALIPKVVVFVLVALAARFHSRRRVRVGDFTTWLRDESSRQS